ncbi:MAG: peptide deformylase [Gammaproteobacteria bacterium]|nr:peptide deformylase [Gammaproteobacteria bacterium]
MSHLPVLEYPDNRLREKAVPVTDFGPALRKQVDDLVETLCASRAIGLAAPQTGSNARIIVVDATGSGRSPMAYINPRIMARHLWAVVEESCLSLPGLEGKVKRCLRLTIEAQDPYGTPFSRQLEDMDAVVVQHEIDHLEGVLFVDRLPLWRQLAWRWRRRNPAG